MRLNAQKVSDDEPEREGGDVEPNGVAVLSDASGTNAQGAVGQGPRHDERERVGQGIDEPIVVGHGLARIAVKQSVEEPLYAAPRTAQRGEQLDGTFGRPPVSGGPDKIEEEHGGQRHAPHDYRSFQTAVRLCNHCFCLECKWSENTEEHQCEVEEVAEHADADANQTPFLGFVGFELCQIILPQGIGGVHTRCLYDGHDAQRQAAAHGGEDGEHHIVVGFYRLISILRLLIGAAGLDRGRSA